MIIRIKSISYRKNLIHSACFYHIKTPHRGNYAILSTQDIKHFESILDPSGVVADKDQLIQFNTDWTKSFVGQSKLVLRPTTTEQVSKILKYCNEKKLAVVPQGGVTGLVGGSNPVHDEIILSMSRMNRIIDFDEHMGIVNVEAGVILENLNKYLETKGFVFPLDLGAKGTCQIGGNISTNAGGIRAIKYGSLHGSVLGLEIVCANGQILNCFNNLRKDNTGYDVKQIFIGAEGTLGVVTKASVLTPKKAKFTNVALLGLNDYDHVMKVMDKAKTDLFDIISALEFFDRGSLDFVLNYLTGQQDPLTTKCEFYLLIETSGSNNDHDIQKITSFLEKSIADSYVIDCIIAQDLSQINQIWSLRESIPSAVINAGFVYNYDISLPVNLMYDIVYKTRKRLNKTPNTSIVGYGHLGDGNLHLNVIVPHEYANEEISNLLEPFIWEETSKEKGSISAEHGLGLLKSKHIHYSKSQSAIDLMHSIKNLLDPNNILNPYKVLPKQNEPNSYILKTNNS